MTNRFLGVLGVLVGGGFIGCSEAPGAVESYRVPEHVRDVWTETIADTTLLRPVDLAVSDSFLVVADGGAPGVRLLSRSGDLVRTLGARGSGPGEIERIGSIAVSATGDIAVNDPGNGRITIFRAPDWSAHQLPLPSGRLGAVEFDVHGRLHVDQRRGETLAPLEDGTEILSVYSEGRLDHSYGVFVSGADPLAQLYLNRVRFSAETDGTIWVLHPYRGTVERWDSRGSLMSTIELPPPEGHLGTGPLTEVNPDGSITVLRMPIAEDLAAAGGNLYVSSLHLRGGNLVSTILVYDENGGLVAHLDLEERASAIAAHEGDLFMLLESSAGARMAHYEISNAVQ